MPRAVERDPGRENILVQVQKQEIAQRQSGRRKPLLLKGGSSFLPYLCLQLIG